MCGWWCLCSSTSRSFCVTGLNAGWLWTNLKAIYSHHWHPVLCTTTQQQQHSAIVEKIMFSPISEATYGTLMCDYFNRVVWFCFTSIFLLDLTRLNCWFKLCMEPKSITLFYVWWNMVSWSTYFVWIQFFSLQVPDILTHARLSDCSWGVCLIQCTVSNKTHIIWFVPCFWTGFWWSWDPYHRQKFTRSFQYNISYHPC